MSKYEPQNYMYNTSAACGSGANVRRVSVAEFFSFSFTRGHDQKSETTKRSAEDDLIRLYIDHTFYTRYHELVYKRSVGRVC